jgi:aryl-alcohol dehydrogenase-like predicted oxidoreductase
VEKTILPVLRELGIGVTAYGVLSRGLLSGSKPTGANDFRAHLPRFTGEGYEQNKRVVEALAAIARTKGATPSQLAIAWVLSRGEDIVPLLGARTRTQLDETLAATALTLTPAELETIEKAVTPEAIVGDRYAPQHMATLDSER